MATANLPTTYAAVTWHHGCRCCCSGLVTAALSYTTGIAAGRRLGSRLASFVGLLEVVAAVGFAWLLLKELPGLVQLLGGVLILAGVVVVKLGERRMAPPSTAPATIGG